MTNDFPAPRISYDGTGMCLTSGTSSYALGNIGDFNTYITPYYPTYTYPTYITNSTVVYRESRTDTAFKIVEKLMDKGHIKELTIKEFTKLVKEIADTL